MIETPRKRTVSKMAEPQQIRRDPVIEEYKKHVDRTLIRRNLQLTVEQRIDKLMKLQQFAQELRRAGTEARMRQ
jgi:hypothetical protein